MNSRKLFMQAAKGQKTKRLPVWLMRQAGRYMKDYQTIRQKYDFLTMCKTPDIAVEVTLQPVKAFDMDAAILFSDILTPLEPMGIQLSFEDQQGPRLDSSAIGGWQNLRAYDVQEQLAYVPQSLSILRQQIPDKALLGFCGAPFTLACYILEGKHGKNFNVIRKMMVQEPETLHRLLDLLARQMGIYLAVQIQSGADAVQVFDSWAGSLPVEQYRMFAQKYQKLTLKYMRKQLKKQSPDINRKDFAVTLFIRNFGLPIAILADSGYDIISLSEIHDLALSRKIWRKKGQKPAIQGNLSPFSLYKNDKSLQKEVAGICQELKAKGHIFNLGHGVFPDIEERKVALVVETVKQTGF